MQKIHSFVPTRKDGRVSTFLVLPDSGHAYTAVVFAHGYGVHNFASGPFRTHLEIAKSLSEQGIASILFAFPGCAESDGAWEDTTPNQRIRVLHDVLDWCIPQFSSLGLYGFSMGGAVAIMVASQRNDLSFLVTCNTVPTFDINAPSATWFSDASNPDNSEHLKQGFFIDRPDPDAVKDAYTSLLLPKLRIQSDSDIPRFQEEFDPIFDAASEPKKCVVIPRADHIFTHPDAQRDLITSVTEWISKQACS